MIVNGVYKPTNITGFLGYHLVHCWGRNTSNYVTTGQDSISPCLHDLPVENVGFPWPSRESWLSHGFPVDLARAQCLLLVFRHFSHHGHWLVSGHVSAPWGTHHHLDGPGGLIWTDMDFENRKPGRKPCTQVISHDDI